MQTSDQEVHGVNFLARSSSDTQTTMPIKKRRFMLARSPSPPPPSPPHESSLLPANNDVPVSQNNSEAVPSVSEILGSPVSGTALTSKGYCEPEVERLMLARSRSPPPPPPPAESSLLPANNDVPVPQNSLEAVSSVSDILGQPVSGTALTSKGYCEPKVERLMLARSRSPPPPPPPPPDESSLLPANNDVPVPQNSLEPVPSVSDILRQPVSRTALTSKGYCEPGVDLVRKVLIQPTDHENLSRSLHQGLRPDMAGKESRQAKEFTPEKKCTLPPVAGVTHLLSTNGPFDPPLKEKHVEQNHVPTRTSMFPTDSGNIEFQLTFKDPMVNGKNSEGICMKQEKLDSASWSLSLDTGKQNVRSKMNVCESEVEPLHLYMDRSNWDLNTTMDSWSGLPSNSTGNRVSEGLSSVGCTQNNKSGSGLEQMSYREPAGAVAAVGKIMLRKNTSLTSSPMSRNESSNPETSLDLQLKPSLMAESFFKWGSTCPLGKVDSSKEIPILSLSVKSLLPDPTSCKSAPVVSRSVKAEPYEELGQKDIGKGGDHALGSSVKHEPHEGQDSPQRLCHSNQKSASSGAVKLEAREGGSQEYLGKQDRLLTSQRMEMTMDTTEHAKTLESRASDDTVLSNAIILQDPSQTVGKVPELATQTPTPDNKIPRVDGLSGTAASQFHKGVVTESSDLHQKSLVSEDQKSSVSSKSVGFVATPCKKIDTKEHVVADVKLEVVGQMCNTDGYNTSQVASTDKLTVDSFVKGEADHNNKEKIELSATIFGKPSDRESGFGSLNGESGALDAAQRGELNDSAKVIGKPSDHKRELSYSNEEAGALGTVPRSELNDSAIYLGKPSDDGRVSSSLHEEVGALEAVQRSQLNVSAEVLGKPSDHDRDLNYSNEEAGALDTVPRSELNDSAKDQPSDDGRVSSSSHEEVGAPEAVQRSQLNVSAEVLGKPSDHDRELSYSNEVAGTLDSIPRSELSDSTKVLGKPSDDERVSSCSHEEVGALDSIHKHELNNSREEAGTINRVHKRPREDDDYEDGEFVDHSLHNTSERSCEEREGKQLKAAADFICPIVVPSEVSSCTDLKAGKVESVEESKILDTENCEDSQSCHTDELGIATMTKIHDSLAGSMADSLKKRPNKSACKMTPLKMKGKGPESKLKSNIALTSRRVTKSTHDEVSSRQMESPTKEAAPGNEKGSSSRIIDLKRVPALDGLAAGRGKSFSSRPISLRVGKERFADNLLRREKSRSQRFRDENINYRSRVFERARNTDQQDGRHGPDLRFWSRAENQTNNDRNSSCEHGLEQVDNSSDSRYTRRLDPSEVALLPESNGSTGNDGRVTQKFMEYGLQNRFHMSYRGRLPSRRGRIQGGNHMIHRANENISPNSYTSREVPDFALRDHDERLTRTLPDGRMIPIGSGACPQYEQEEANLSHRERRSRERRSLSPLICRERSLSPIRRRGPIEFPPICLESSPRCQPRRLHQWSPPRRSSNVFNGPPELVGRPVRSDRMRPPHELPYYFAEDEVVNGGSSPDYVARLSDDTGDVGPSRQRDFSRRGRGLQRNMRRFDTIDSRRNMQRFDTIDSQNFPEDYFHQCGELNGNVEFADRNCNESLERRVLVHGRPFQRRPPNDNVDETFHPHIESGPLGSSRFCHEDDYPGDYDGHVRNRLGGRLRGIEQEDDYRYHGEHGWRDASMGDGGLKRKRVERH